MNSLFFLGIITFVFAVGFTSQALGETFEVIITGISSTQGCETTDSCLSPSNLTLTKGDTVNWIRQEDTTHFIQSYTDSQLNWATLDYTHTFNRAGIFQYTISEFPWVQGVINVKYTQELNGIPNYLNFISVKKIDKNLHLEYEGHIDTQGGKMMVYTTNTNQRVLNFGVSPDIDGYFSTVLIDPDDSYHTWVDGIYRVEFWSVDGDNGNKKSDIIETSFSLNSQTELISETVTQVIQDPEPQVIEESKLPDWVRNIFIWYANNQISEDELIEALQFLVNEGIIKLEE